MPAIRTKPTAGTVNSISSCFEKTTPRLPQNDPAFFMNIARQERELLRAIQHGDEEEARALLSKHLREQVDLLSA